jgi:hypothetical protein
LFRKAEADFFASLRSENVFASESDKNVFAFSFLQSEVNKKVAILHIQNFFQWVAHDDGRNFV